jgi:hypothetical protein
MRTVLCLTACFAILLTSGASAKPADRFDLYCHGSAKQRGEPLPYDLVFSLKVDLARKVFCIAYQTTHCGDIFPITHMDRRVIKSDDTGSGTEAHIIIYRSSWRFRNTETNSIYRDIVDGHIRRTVLATCVKDDFSGIDASTRGTNWTKTE